MILISTQDDDDNDDARRKKLNSRYFAERTRLCCSERWKISHLILPLLIDIKIILECFFLVNVTKRQPAMSFDEKEKKFLAHKFSSFVLCYRDDDESDGSIAATWNFLALIKLVMNYVVDFALALWWFHSCLHRSSGTRRVMIKMMKTTYFFLKQRIFLSFCERHQSHQEAANNVYRKRREIEFNWISSEPRWCCF